MSSDLSDAAYDELAAALGPLHLPRAYCPVEPTAKQEWFLRRDELEVFFGGAAGPGKSWALLMAALQYVDVPGYAAILLRPTLSEFEQEGGLIDVSHEWLDMTDARWHGSRREWMFPSTATVRFGYLANAGDVRQYKGAAYSFCGFDELTGFQEPLYRAMFRVLRQPKPGGSEKGDDLEAVPLRMRGASNPGDLGHPWVKSRFVDPASRVTGAIYVPALIHDNPFLDYEEYLKSLAHLSPLDRIRLINGDWDVMEEGGHFNREAFNVIDAADAEKPVRALRYWDLAATEPSPSNPDPDYTVGLRLEHTATGRFTIRHVVRGRWSAAELERRMQATARADGRGVEVRIEQEPGASGKLAVSYYQRHVLAGFPVHRGLPRGGDKEVRSRPVAAAVANGLVDLVRGDNTIELLDEAAIFPHGAHDDIVDALAGAHTYLTKHSNSARRASAVPRGRIPTAGNSTRPLI